MERALILEVRKLEASPISEMVRKRLSEFRSYKDEDQLFSELCFCILAANFTSEKSWKIQKAIGRGFIDLDEGQLALELRKNKYRFPNVRAGYIVRSRRFKEAIPKVIRKLKGEELRSFFVNNIPGIGIKEASHFLRNVGIFDFAIVDFHIIDILSRYGLIERPKSMTPKKYFQAEGVLSKLSTKLNMSQGELDLYLWYMETGQILK